MVSLQQKIVLLAVLLLSILLAQSNAYAKVSAATGRTVLSIDESIILQIKSSDNSGKPDLSVLETNFKILNKNQSQNYSFINGKSSSTHIWSIGLLDKTTGEITITAIQVGDETTQPIHLVIRQPSSTPGIDGKEAFLKISISDGKQSEFYVKQLIFV